MIIWIISWCREAEIRILAVEQSSSPLTPSLQFVTGNGKYRHFQSRPTPQYFPLQDSEIDVSFTFISCQMLNSRGIILVICLIVVSKILLVMISSWIDKNILLDFKWQHKQCTLDGYSLSLILSWKKCLNTFLSCILKCLRACSTIHGIQKQLNFMLTTCTWIMKFFQNSVTQTMTWENIYFRESWQTGTGTARSWIRTPASAPIFNARRDEKER